MKTKVVVCSTSGIDYIAHNEDIESLPVILKFREEEKYLDYIDITAEAFYNRMRMDKACKMTPTFFNYTMVIDFVNKIKEDGYERILFILASKSFSDLYVSIKIAMSQNNDIYYDIYESNTVCYPLAYMALEASRLFGEQMDFDDVRKRLDDLQRVNELFFFNPKYSEASHFFKKGFKSGEILVIENGKLTTRAKTKLDSLEELVFHFCSQTSNVDVIPFILYTSKNSKYISIIQRNLECIDKKYKKIKTYPLDPAVGIQTGINSICLGYVLK